jgi:predicted CXXCH cytochrome family protein
VKPRCGTLLRLTLSLIAFLALVLPTRGADDKKSAPDKSKSSQTNKYVRPTDPSLYVGADTCKTCHGKAHVEGGGDVSKIFTFKNATPEETSARCLDCHQNREEQSNYSRSAHLRSGVACIDCHSPHHAKAAEFLLKESPPKLCYGCHMDVRAVCKGPALSNELSIPAVLRRIRRTRVVAQS